ncbi:MAG TPA: murein biosynthesis integral membrane protein MurJ [Desulfotomaculum sp.]|nr:murein biosynthesis integral membrane protein MurJ [Desulfotomaculum sp.]
MSTGKIIARATALILGLTLLSRFLGLGREMAIAYRFGATGTTDAFLVAFIIPYAFYSVVGMALTTAIVPVFAEYAAQGRREEAWRVLSLVVNAALVALAVAALFGVAGAPFIARALGGGFPPETLQLATVLTATMMPSIVFMGLAGIFGGILNANNIFGPPACGPAAMNVSVILSALIVAAWFGVFGLAAGAVTGALIFALVQVPALRHVGFRYSRVLSFRDPAVRQVLALMWPVALTSGVGSVYMMIDWRLASGLAEGSIAALNYANKLMQLPQGLFVLALTTAIFPTLSKLAAESRVGEMTAALQKGLKVILLLAVPGAVGLMVLREPVVTLLFERGAFDARATAMSAEALLFYGVGLIGFCLNFPLTRGFFAMRDMRTPLLVLLSTVVVKLFFNLLLVRFLAHAGLALATSLTALVNMAVLAWLLERRLPGLFDGSFFRLAGGVLAASAAMGFIVHVLDGYLAAHLPGGSLALALRVGLDIACGAAVFAAAGLILRLDEPRYLLDLVRDLSRRWAGAAVSK